ncbi:MAG TPA: DUF924 family protein [Burkholderiaceae bacterium]|jgi:uncharacterized protein (DUF924 family)|nr:DUF924 family protein [Burkholderiaceae bacterium]
MPSVLPGLDDVLAFWFDELAPKDWWAKSQAIDETIATRFRALHEAGARCELHAWRATAAGRLAEILVLDQFSRNLWRHSALAFACDPLALGLAQTAVAAGAGRELDAVRRPFLYMPFMHSESRAIHADALALFRDHAPANLEHEIRHKAIVDRYGRFPHRNAVLGRSSTPDELEFLKTPGSAF